MRGDDISCLKFVISLSDAEDFTKRASGHSLLTGN